MDEELNKLQQELGEIIQESASSVLPMLIPKETALALGEIAQWSPEAYDESMVLVTTSFSEGPSGSLYYVLSAKLVSVLVDLMLGGDGAADRPVNEESKDALKEMINQVLGVVASTMRERWEGAANFAQVEVHSLEPNIDLNLLLGDDDLLRIPLEVSVGGAAVGTLAACLPEDSVVSIHQDLIEAEPGAAPASTAAVEEDPVAAAMAEASAEASAEAAQKAPAAAAPAPAAGPALDASAGNVGLILDIELPIVIRLGTSEMALKDIIRLGPGSIIELSKMVDEPVELLVNDKIIAHGEVVVVEGNFAFRVTEVESKTSRIKSLV